MPLSDTKTLIARFERQAHRMGELWERCQGKGWPAAESEEFTALRDVRAPATRAVLEAIESAATAPLLAQIAAQEAAVRRHEIALLQSVDQLAKVAELEAQLLEAKKDAERYRFATDPQAAGFAVCAWYGEGWIAISEGELDAAIAQEQK